MSTNTQTNIRRTHQSLYPLCALCAHGVIMYICALIRKLVRLCSFPGMGSKRTDPDSLSVNLAAPPQKPPLRKGKLLSMHSDCHAPQRRSDKITCARGIYLIGVYRTSSMEISIQRVYVYQVIFYRNYSSTSSWILDFISLLIQLD